MRNVALILLAIVAIGLVSMRFANFDTGADNPADTIEPIIESPPVVLSPSSTEAELRQVAEEDAAVLVEQASAERVVEVYDPVLDAQLAAEPIDQNWAPQMEATFDSVLRSLGGQIVEIEVQCRTRICRAVATHADSIALMTEDERSEVFMPMMRTFGRLSQPIIEQESDRLNMASMTQTGPELPGETEPPWQSIFYLGWQDDLNAGSD